MLLAVAEPQNLSFFGTIFPTGVENNNLIYYIFIFSI